MLSIRCKMDTSLHSYMRGHKLLRIRIRIRITLFYIEFLKLQTLAVCYLNVKENANSRLYDVCGQKIMVSLWWVIVITELKVPRQGDILFKVAQLSSPAVVLAQPPLLMVGVVSPYVSNRTGRGTCIYLIPVKNTFLSIQMPF